MKKTFIIIIAILLSSRIYSSNDSIPRVSALSKVYEDRISLRFTVSTPLGWKLANEYGFMIERYTIMPDGTKIKKILTKEVLKPKPIEDFEPYLEDNKFVAIAAQTIYGESFEVDMEGQSEKMKLIGQAEELENRFLFAMIAISQSKLAAKLMAASFVDTDIEKGVKYIYKIYSKVPKKKMQIDTAYLLVDPNELTEMPKINSLRSKTEEKKSILSWDVKYLQDIYSFYFIERSDDGITFDTINENPFYSNAQENQQGENMIYFMDSVPQYFKTYYYRIRAIDGFADYSPYSNVIKVKALPKLKNKPKIEAGTVIDDKEVMINWYIAKEDSSIIKGFNLLRASKMMDTYKKINDDLLNISDRSYIYKLSENSGSVNYFILEAIGIDSNSYKSMPYLIQLQDSIPPSKPIGLAGTIDTLGIVHLYWKENPELDVQGYRVYVSNHKEAEFSQVTKTLTDSSSFSDTINIKTLTEEIYYKIQAIDNHYNRSEFSDILKLEKPDLIPPRAVVFSKVESEKDGVFFSWSESSKDVIAYLIYRKEINSEEWIMIDSLSNDMFNFFDNEEANKNYCHYKVIALDDYNNKSLDNKEIKLKRINTGIGDELENVKVIAMKEDGEVIIKWKNQDVEKLTIYKGENDNPITIFKNILNPDDGEFIDKKISVNEIYKYRIKAKYKNGNYSPFSKEFIIQF